MDLKIDRVHKTIVMVLIYNLCLVTDVSNEKTIQIPNLTISNVDSNFETHMRAHSIFKRFSNKTEAFESPIQENDYGIMNTSKKNLIPEELDTNRSDIQSGRIMDKEDEMPEEYYGFNYTGEPCVGDPDYCNFTYEEYMEMLNDYIFPHPYEWVLIATHAIVFVIGLIGNALVCIAVYRNHSMRTVTNYFIVNLAVADFMVILICLPPTVLWDVTETWFFGTAMCRIVLYFQVSLF